MTHYERLKRKRLSDLIVDENIVSKEAMLAALQEQQSGDRLLSTILLDAKEIDAYDLARVMVEQYQVPFIELTGYNVHKDLVEEFPVRLLHESRMLPIERFGKNICFACQEIPSADIYAKLKETVEGSVFVFAALSRDIQEKLSELAPYEAEIEVDEMAGAAAGAESPMMGLDGGTSSSEWQSLFDTADESVMSELEVPDVD
ncbi:MAG: GspE/PulE/PilB domain-containing protein [Planctomycetota bacterium]|jgi:hypothetical protein